MSITIPGLMENVEVSTMLFYQVTSGITPELPGTVLSGRLSLLTIIGTVHLLHTYVVQVCTVYVADFMH